MIPIIDTHQHLWDLNRFRLPWITADSPLGHNHLMEDYLREAAGLNVVKTVYMEVDVDPAQQVQEAEYVIALCRDPQSPMAAAVISGHPASEQFPEYIRRFQDTPEVKGVRQVLHGGTPAGYCLSPEFISGCRILGEMGLRFDICIRPTELLDAAKLADACPDTRFILDHCGNANVQGKDRSQWQRDIAEVAKRSSVVCKISGIVASAKPGEWSAEDLAPIVLHCAEVFGPDRIFFGGDWPVCTLAASLRQWIEALREIVSGWSEENQHKLWHGNAERVYGIGP
jgi:predicted TIM-barrel fold metal-dependent hydrolase